MRELVSYNCKTCGGALIVERNQAVFNCPFCGNAFDLVRLQREELLSDAASSMMQMEFHAARQRYETVLSKDPLDFEALLGLVLCDGKLRSAGSLENLSRMASCDLNDMKKTASKVKNRAVGKDTPYFEKLEKLIDTAIEYRQNSNDKASLHEEYLNQSKATITTGESWKAKYAFAVLGIYYGLYIVSFLSLYFSANSFRNLTYFIFIYIALAIVGLILTIIVFEVVVKRILMDKRRGKMYAISYREDIAGKKIEDIKARFETIYAELKENEPVIEKTQIPKYVPPENKAGG